MNPKKLQELAEAIGRVAVWLAWLSIALIIGAVLWAKGRAFRREQSDMRADLDFLRDRMGRVRDRVNNLEAKNLAAEARAEAKPEGSA